MLSTTLHGYRTRAGAGVLRVSSTRILAERVRENLLLLLLGSAAAGRELVVYVAQRRAQVGPGSGGDRR